MIISKGIYIQNCAIKLHSEFDHVINFMMLDGHIVSVVDESVGRGPSRMVVNKLPNITEARALFRESESHLVYDSAIPVVTFENFIRRVPLLKTFTTTIQTDSCFDRTFEDLFSLKIKSAQTVSELILSLKGLGPGLTPSGDDFILGLLTSLVVFNKDSSALFDLSKGENPFVNSFLLELKHGQINEIIKRFLLSFSQNDEAIIKETSAIIGQGETSGMDWLKGFITGIERFV